jgi:hypothetical protein
VNETKGVLMHGEKEEKKAKAEKALKSYQPDFIL